VARRDRAHQPALDPPESDARGSASETGDLVRVETEIGHFVVKAWVTEGIRPGVVACSHHMGRWKLPRAPTASARRWPPSRSTATASLGAVPRPGAGPFESSDPDTKPHLVDRRRRAPEPDLPGAPRPDLGHALLAPGRPRPPAEPGDRYGDIVVDTEIDPRRARSTDAWLRARRHPAPQWSRPTARTAPPLAHPEAYPDLKADASFRRLQADLVDVEEHLQYARRFYNGAVRDLNDAVQRFPDLFVARAAGFAAADFFQAADEARGAVAVELSR
jgi:hypothetical protein